MKDTSVLRVLLLEDSDESADRVTRELGRGDWHVVSHRVDTRARFAEALQSNEWEVIVAGRALADFDAETALAHVRETGKDIPFVIATGDLTHLCATVEREMEAASVRADSQRMRDRLVVSERMATAGNLAAGVMHEINSSLAIAVVNLEFIALKLTELGSDARKEPWIEAHLGQMAEPIRDARKAAEQIKDIVRDVQLFSRSRDDTRGAVDLERVIESSLRMAWSEIGHRAKIVKELGDVPRAFANEARIGQVLLNLIVNAAQAMPTGDASTNEIRIATSHVEDWVVVEVSDTGVGIPKENLARIFDAFFTTKSVNVASGLGLSICHRIIADLGGTITVDSEVGKGTRVRFTLPVVVHE